jgi:molybdenum cofactor guanylyltransferase
LALQTSEMSAVIVAGGKSSRMGKNKLHMPLGDKTVIGHLISTTTAFFAETIIVTDDSLPYRQLPVKTVQDSFLCQEKNSLVGIHAGLAESKNPYVFVAAGDMPFIRPEVMAALSLRADGYDVTIPREGSYFQPLCAVYHKNCLPHMEKLLRAGIYKILDFFPDVRVHCVPSSVLAVSDPDLISFFNINTPDDYQEACHKLKKIGKER